jgi:CubicO group peptidase (beta-lactamase class C family)
MFMPLRRLLGTLTAQLVLTASLAAQGLPTADPASVGLSDSRLRQLSEAFEDYVADGRIAGAVGLVARHGRVAFYETWGYRDVARRDPMDGDDLFRIYSMTKPITSVATMILAEEGHFRISDPVGRYLPQLQDLEVALWRDGNDETVTRPAPAVTIEDLLRHTSGFTYGSFTDTPVDRLYREARPLRGSEPTEAFLDRLGDLPLMYEPGTRWNYSVSTDVLGALVESISGMPLDQFLDERILGPLRMDDTRFYVDESRRSRFARMYGHDEGRDLVPGDSTRYLSRPVMVSGGGGLVSSAEDYVRFAQMLLNGGELEGVRILEPETVELMTTDRLGDIPGLDLGFGLGFAVRQVPGTPDAPGTIGEYGWSGIAGTSFWVDPAEDLIGVIMMQILPNRDVTFYDVFKRLVYRALEE